MSASIIGMYLAELKTGKIAKYVEKFGFFCAFMCPWPCADIDAHVIRKENVSRDGSVDSLSIVSRDEAHRRQAGLSGKLQLPMHFLCSSLFGWNVHLMNSHSIVLHVLHWISCCKTVSFNNVYIHWQKNTFFRWIGCHIMLHILFFMPCIVAPDKGILSNHVYCT